MGLTNSDDEEDAVVDLVSWQSSQASNALELLLKSSENDCFPRVDVPGSSKALESQGSSDSLIPGFSRLGTTDDGISPTKSGTTSQKKRPSSSRPSRPRHSDSSLRASSLGLDTDNQDSASPLPFFDKTDPSQFMALLKGVSARLDGSVRARPSSSGATARPPRKRPRVTSPVETSRDAELLSAGVKKSRTELEDSGVREREIRIDKGKGRAEYEDVSAASYGTRTIEPFVSSRDESHTASTSKSAGFASHTDIDMEGDGEDDTSTLGGPRKRPPPQRTMSQLKMPPPPVPLPKRHGAGSTSNADSSRPIHSSSSSSRNHPPHSSSQPTKEVPPRKLEPVPKLHPLLVQQQQKQRQPHTNVSTPPAPRPAAVPCSPASASLANKLKSYTNSQKRSTPPVTSMSPIPKPLFQPVAQHPQEGAAGAPPSSTPSFSQSFSRLPPLGMRRAHTLPSTGTSGLPTKQKGFRPPLLSSSQPQPTSSSQSYKPAAMSNVVASTTKAPTTNSSRPSHHPRQGSAGSEKHAGPPSSSHQGGLSSSGSSSHRSHNPSSSFSTSSSSATTRASSVSSIGSPVVPAKLGTSAAATTHKSATATTTTISSSPSLPEPLDGDGDSSFDDISFDMDALEETMKMYD
ncbi:hypothetical protein D9613_010493 [Agrocybe pediades]|uniref:Uncharacterized protein n=1 Tax=Agrocybe pediades TaxID=84607 RepID=A0A8H4QGH1_9AGAR|nr:hypothetical protein D9613_010493 [Agrocybe pediades]